MHHLKSIRDRLGITQQAMADGIGCTQGNVGHYERGQTLLPDMARKVINFCADYGLVITFDHVYGDTALPSPTEPSAQDLDLSTTELDKAGLVDRREIVRRTDDLSKDAALKALKAGDGPAA